MKEAEILAAYVRSRPDFKMFDSLGGCWAHMGATLADAVLQAGIHYESVVRPRVKKIKEKYPEAATTSGLAQVLARIGAAQFLNWKEGAKPERFRALVDLLLSNRIETEAELRVWLENPANLKRVQQVRGVKDKTAHYLHILVGGETVAIDMHLFDFLAEAGLPTKDFAVAHRIVVEAAALLGIQPSILDHSIWQYMSNRAGRRILPACAAK